MTGIQFRPARRENTPLIIGLAGPTKSGKTFSAHRIAVGLAQGGPVVMINAEGAKGHQYADKFDYIATDITPPFRPQRYTEYLNAALAVEPRPAVIIIDSLSHMHDGPGGLLEYQSAELDRLAGQDLKKRDRMNASSWIKPKASENEFVYAMLGSDCHIIACLRAREKLKWVKGSAPIELGLQPIVSERVAFETIFTLTLPAHSKGVPDLAVSEMRTPFDEIVPAGAQLSEETGAKLAAWAAGSSGAGIQNGPESRVTPESAAPPGVPAPDEIPSPRTQLLDLYPPGPERDAVADYIDGHARTYPDTHDGWLSDQLEKKRAEGQQEQFPIPEAARS